MPAKRLGEEFGYSLVEVMISILILAIAILPMMTMFDMGLQGATANSNYDKARTLANQKLEQAKNLPFVDVENNFPEAGNGTPFDSALLTEPGADFANFQYTVEKDYMKQPPTDTTEEDQVDPSVEFVECNPLNDCEPPSNLIRVAVTVQWSNGDNTNTYTTFGLVAK